MKLKFVLGAAVALAISEFGVPGALPAGKINYNAYTTNTTAGVDARVLSLAGGAISNSIPENVLTNGQSGVLFGNDPPQGVIAPMVELGGGTGGQSGILGLYDSASGKTNIIAAGDGMQFINADPSAEYMFRGGNVVVPGLRITDSGGTGAVFTGTNAATSKARMSEATGFSGDGSGLTNIAGYQSVINAIANRHYDHIVVISNTTISVALTEITDASYVNRYLLYLTNGTYADHIIPKSFVDIVGQSQAGVYITNSTDNSTLANIGTGAGNNWMLANFTIELMTNNSTAGNALYAIHLDQNNDDGARPIVGGVTASEMILYKLNVIGKRNSAIGVGLYGSQRLYVIDCNVTNLTGHGVYVHNRVTQSHPCGVYVLNSHMFAPGYAGYLWLNLGSGHPDVSVVWGGNCFGSATNLYGDIDIENAPGYPLAAGEGVLFADPLAAPRVLMTVGTRLLSPPPTHPSHIHHGT